MADWLGGRLQPYSGRFDPDSYLSCRIMDSLRSPKPIVRGSNPRSGSDKLNMACALGCIGVLHTPEKSPILLRATMGDEVPMVGHRRRIPGYVDSVRGSNPPASALGCELIRDQVILLR